MNDLDFVLLMKNLESTNFIISDLFILVKRWVEEKGYEFKGITDIRPTGVYYSLSKVDKNYPTNYHLLQGKDFVSFDQLFEFSQGVYEND